MYHDQYTRRRTADSFQENDRPQENRIQDNWSWGLFAGFFIVQVTARSIWVSFGVIFSFILKDTKHFWDFFWTPLLYTVIWLLSEPWVKKICKRINASIELMYIILVGLTTSWFGLIISVKCPLTASHLIPLIGVAGGLGTSFTMTGSTCLLEKHFPKRPGALRSINQSVAALTVFVMPIISFLIMDNFGDHGGLLIHSGILMQGFIGGILLKNANWQKEQNEDPPAEEKIYGILDGGTESETEERTFENTGRNDKGEHLIIEIPQNTPVEIANPHNQKIDQSKLPKHRIFPVKSKKCTSFGVEILPSIIEVNESSSYSDDAEHDINDLKASIEDLNKLTSDLTESTQKVNVLKKPPRTFQHYKQLNTELENNELLNEDLSVSENETETECEQITEISEEKVTECDEEKEENIQVIDVSATDVSDSEFISEDASPSSPCEETEKLLSLSDQYQLLNNLTNSSNEINCLTDDEPEAKKKEELDNETGERKQTDIYWDVNENCPGNREEIENDIGGKRYHSFSEERKNRFKTSHHKKKVDIILDYLHDIYQLFCCTVIYLRHIFIRTPLRNSYLLEPLLLPAVFLLYSIQFSFLGFISLTPTLINRFIEDSTEEESAFTVCLTGFTWLCFVIASPCFSTIHFTNHHFICTTALMGSCLSCYMLSGSVTQDEATLFSSLYGICHGITLMTSHSILKLSFHGSNKLQKMQILLNTLIAILMLLSGYFIGIASWTKDIRNCYKLFAILLGLSGAIWTIQGCVTGVRARRTLISITWSRRRRIS